VSAKNNICPKFKASLLWPAKGWNKQVQGHERESFAPFLACFKPFLSIYGGCSHAIQD